MIVDGTRCQACHAGPLEWDEPHLACSRCGAQYDEDGHLVPYPWDISEELRTRLSPVRLTCDTCDHEFTATVATFVNVAQHPAFETELALERLNTTACPACEREANVVPPGLTWYDPAAGLAITLVSPDRDPWTSTVPHVPVKPTRIQGLVAVALAETLAAKKAWPIWHPAAASGGSFTQVTTSTMRHLLTDQGFGLPWFHVHLTQLVAGQPRWTWPDLERRIGRPVEGRVPKGLEALADAGILEIDGTAAQRTVRVSRRLLRQLFEDRDRWPHHTVHTRASPRGLSTDGLPPGCSGLLPIPDEPQGRPDRTEADADRILAVIVRLARDHDEGFVPYDRIRSETAAHGLSVARVRSALRHLKSHGKIYSPIQDHYALVDDPDRPPTGR